MGVASLTTISGSARYCNYHVHHISVVLLGFDPSGGQQRLEREMDVESLVECVCDFAESVIRCLLKEHATGHEHEADIGIVINENLIAV